MSLLARVVDGFNAFDELKDGTMHPNILINALEGLGMDSQRAGMLIAATRGDFEVDGRIKYEPFLRWLCDVPPTLIFPDIGVLVPELMMPRVGTDMTKWSIIACDQYTSEPAYWQRVKDFVGADPSMLHLVYPEVYMPDKRDKEYIDGIGAKMSEYMSSDVFEKLEPGFVCIDRRLPNGDWRKGLLVALDLEHYSFEKGSQSLIRATEKTIEARLPPRIAIRENAPIESPHILVLIDDAAKTVIEPLFERRGGMKKLYDFDLMEDSGHLTGHHVASAEDIASAVSALRALSDAERFRAKYDAEASQGVILFPVGDGNHSLATAKRCWERLRANGAGMDHPARHALVELNNIHDDGLVFHPIHRLVEGIDPAAAVADMRKFYESQGSSVRFAQNETLTQADAQPDCHKFEFLSKDMSGVFTISAPKMVLEAATLDSWLNTYLSTTEGELDYVHEQYTIEAKTKGNARTAGFFLPSINKNDLVRTVVMEGSLPRKTFSMGHAPEKRFYCECRRVTPE